MALIFGNAVAIDGAEVELSINIDGGEIGVFYDTGGGSFPIYQGPYEVDPTFTDIVLPTTNHIMNDDVTVHEIYVGRVTNPQGGKTITIGV